MRRKAGFLVLGFCVLALVGGSAVGAYFDSGWTGVLAYFGLLITIWALVLGGTWAIKAIEEGK